MVVLLCVGMVVVLTLPFLIYGFINIDWDRHKKKDEVIYSGEILRLENQPWQEIFELLVIKEGRGAFLVMYIDTGLLTEVDSYKIKLYDKTGKWDESEAARVWALIKKHGLDQAKNTLLDEYAKKNRGIHEVN